MNNIDTAPSTDMFIEKNYIVSLSINIGIDFPADDSLKHKSAAALYEAWSSCRYRHLLLKPVHPYPH